MTLASVGPVASLLRGLSFEVLLVLDDAEGPFSCAFFEVSLLLIFDFSFCPDLTFCVILERDAFPKVFRGVSEPLKRGDELVTWCGLRRPSFA